MIAYEYKGINQKDLSHFDEREEKEDIIKKMIFQKDYLLSFTQSDFLKVYQKIMNDFFPDTESVNIYEEILLFF